MRAFGWLRQVRPALVPVQLLAGLVLFVLPWIEVRCNDDRPGKRADAVMRQSGLQAALAGYSHHSDPDLATMVRNALQGRAGGTSKEDSFHEPLRSAPFLAVYALALAAGFGLSIVLWRSRWRRLVVAGCCLTACCCLLAQVVAGFPLQDSILVENRVLEEERLWTELQQCSFDEPLAIRRPPLFLLDLTWSVDLSMLVLLTTLATLLVERKSTFAESPVSAANQQPLSAAPFETSQRTALPHCSEA
jgi:hypothetical protein